MKNNQCVNGLSLRFSRRWLSLSSRSWVQNERAVDIGEIFDELALWLPDRIDMGQRLLLENFHRHFFR